MVVVVVVAAVVAVVAAVVVVVVVVVAVVGTVIVVIVIVYIYSLVVLVLAPWSLEAAKLEVTSPSSRQSRRVQEAGMVLKGPKYPNTGYPGFYIGYWSVEWHTCFLQFLVSGPCWVKLPLSQKMYTFFPRATKQPSSIRNCEYSLWVLGGPRYLLSS